MGVFLLLVIRASPDISADARYYTSLTFIVGRQLEADIDNECRPKGKLRAQHK